MAQPLTFNSPVAFSSTAKSWNTPQKLQGFLAAIVIADALFLGILLTAAGVHRHQLKTIGKDAAPSIIAAQHIKAAISDMDANAAAELLAKPGQAPQAVEAYDSRRFEASKALITAAENITYGDAERIPIQTLQISLSDYETKLERARDLHERSDPKALAVYRDAAAIADTKLIPAADALDKANLDVLERTYRTERGSATFARACVFVLGLTLLGFLLAAQRFLNHRMRRVLNPALALATLVTLGVLFFAYTALTSEAHHLKVAKEDAFTSIHALWQARAAGYAANADQNRYLLDDLHAADAERGFWEKAARLATIPPGTTYVDVETRSGMGNRVSGFSGYLADELNNVTFANELQPAQETLRRWGDYIDTDRKVRQLRQSGQTGAAIQLSVGNKPTQSNWAYEQFDQSLGDTLDVNQRAFDEAITQGYQALSNFDLFATLSTIAVAGLAVLGLFRRIQEYL